MTNWTDNNLNTSVTESGLTLTQGQVYYFSIKSVNGAGLNSVCSSDGILASIIAGIDENQNAINVSVQPNPFNENATLFFTQKTEQRLTITLTDVLGKEIVIANTNYAAGKHSIDINASELKLAKGLYTFRISSEKFSSSLRLINY